MTARDTLRVEQTTGGQCADLIAWGRGAEASGSRRRSRGLVKVRHPASAPRCGRRGPTSDQCWRSSPTRLLVMTSSTRRARRASTAGSARAASRHAPRFTLLRPLSGTSRRITFPTPSTSGSRRRWRRAARSAGARRRRPRVTTSSCAQGSTASSIVNPCVDDLFGCSAVPGGSIRVTHSTLGAPRAAITRRRLSRCGRASRDSTEGRRGGDPRGDARRRCSSASRAAWGHSSGSPVC